MHNVLKYKQKQFFHFFKFFRWTQFSFQVSGTFRQNFNQTNFYLFLLTLFVGGEWFGGKGNELIGRGFGTFSANGFDYDQRREGLHLWERNSPVWVHFGLLKSAMLWRKEGRFLSPLGEEIRKGNLFLPIYREMN